MIEILSIKIILNVIRHPPSINIQCINVTRSLIWFDIRIQCKIMDKLQMNYILILMGNIQLECNIFLHWPHNYT